MSDYKMSDYKMAQVAQTPGPVANLTDKAAAEAKTKKPKKVHTADVVRHGEQLILPSTMTIDGAVEVLTRLKKFEEEEVSISETVNCFLWEGALAMRKAMERLYGAAMQERTPGFFGSTPPKLISVETGLGETTLVPWGRFSLPNVTGVIGTGADVKDGRLVFLITANVLRKHEAEIKRLAELTRQIARDESIYRGKAFKMRFKDSEGGQEVMAMPRFIDLGAVRERELIFAEEVTSAIATSLFTPIEHAARCREYRIPLKRGVLLYGPYGTGKTLAAYVTAKKCVDNGWTFLYCERADELADMVKFAHHYQPAVVFCEDIDRVVDGERSVKMDDILNIIDGIESKSTELMVVLTTNHVENINKAMLRPGRLDAVINVLPPDAKAVEQLVRLYGRGLIPEDVDLRRVGMELAGKIPAVIREAVERAKLSALKIGNGQMVLSAEALLDAAQGMRNQLELLKTTPKLPTIEENLGNAVVKAVAKAVDGAQN